MNHVDYSNIKELLARYGQIFAPSLSVEQNDLVAEMTTKLSDLDQVSRKIVDLVSNLDTLRHPEPIPDGDGYDTIRTISGHSLRLKRADPNVPITRVESVVGYVRGAPADSISPEIRNLERKLERATFSFYQLAHRVTHITKNLPRLNSFNCSSVRVVRNQLLEHPEGKDSGVTFDTFVCSNNDGPCVKGMRRGGQTKHRDEGFRKNSEQFVSNLTKTLRQALASWPISGSVRNRG
jgi:hypothetical protein